MHKNLEQLHKLLGSVCGEICISLVIFRVTGGKRTLERWLRLVREAESVLSAMVEK